MAYRDAFALAAQWFESGNIAGSLTLARELLAQKTDDPDLWYLAGRAELALGRPAAGRELLERAIALRGDDVRYHHSLALTYRREARFEEAHAAFERALAIAPGNAIVLGARADTYMLEGKHDAAQATLRPLIESGKWTLSAAMAFSKMARRLGLEREAAAALEGCLGERGLMARSVVSGLFALAALYDGMGEFDRAFECLSRANGMVSVRYDAEAHSAAVDRTIASWSAEAFERLPRSSETTDRPVFVVGVPRSGTSLVEQIVSSHPRVEGRGELGILATLTAELQPRQAAGEPLLESPEGLRRSGLDRLARRYLERLGTGGEGVLRVTDKNPCNVLRLGLVALMLPGARVIRCVRDAMDTGLSCYMYEFAGAYDFAYRLEWLGRFIRDERRLAAHWKRVLPIPMLDVVYEELVGSQERVSREMVSFLGLEWDDACLRFHESERTVMTASNEQVRRPMYATSVGRWKAYERHLGLLRAGLGEAGA